MAAAIVGVAWFGPSRDYLYVPNKATPGCLQGDGRGREGAGTGPGSALLRRRLDPAGDLGREAPRVRATGRLRRSSRVGPVVPPGSSFEARHEDGLREMARSEKVAAAVALKQAGFKVKTTNKGALVEVSRVRRSGRDEARRG